MQDRGLEAGVSSGRYTALHDGDIVVFLIGMRVNKLLAFRKWIPVAASMGPMLSELAAHPEKGYLGGRACIDWPGVTMVQYWRSFEDLERFARNPQDPHFPAWAAFHRTIGSDGSVGIWHETYVLRRGDFEAIYVNMPRTGLAAATRHVRVDGPKGTARKRLGALVEPAQTPTESIGLPEGV